MILGTDLHFIVYQVKIKTFVCSSVAVSINIDLCGAWGEKLFR